MSDERALTIVQSMIHERQRLLIREANHLRELVGLPPVRAEDGVVSPAMAESTPPPDAHRPSAHLAKAIALNHNRRAILRAVTLALERDEEPTYSVIRALSGVPERGATRAPKWAVEAGVLVPRGGVYLPGAATESGNSAAAAGT